jgi:hypothetical protein
MAMLSSQHPLMEVEERLVGAVVGGEGRALAVVWEEMGDGDKRQQHCCGRRRGVVERRQRRCRDWTHSGTKWYCIKISDPRL